MRTSVFNMLAVLSYVAMIGAIPAAENNRRDMYVSIVSSYAGPDVIEIFLCIVSDVLGISQELPSIMPPLPVPPQELPEAHLPHVGLGDLPAPVELSPPVDIS